MSDRSRGARTVGAPGPTNCRDCADYYRDHRHALLGYRDLDERLAKLLEQGTRDLAADLGLPQRLTDRVVAATIPTFNRSLWMASWFQRFHRDGHLPPYTLNDGDSYTDPLPEDPDE